MDVGIKNGQQNHKAIVTENSVFCACNIKAYLYMFVHCMNYAHINFMLHCSDIISEGLVSVLYWAWLVEVLSGLLPACLNVVWRCILSVLSSNLVNTLFGVSKASGQQNS